MQEPQNGNHQVSDKLLTGDQLLQSRRSFLSVAVAGSALAILPGTGSVAGDIGSALSSSKIADEPNKITKLIATATGGISPDQLGITSIHEHIPAQSDPVLRQKTKDFAVRDLIRARQLGLNTIVDVGPTRDAALNREVSELSGVNIVCCTGFYILNESQLSFKVQDFEAHMVSEMENGIQGTDIRPGVIKVAAKGLPIRPAERNLFIAAAKVHRRYGVPICTHAVSGCAEQQQILEEAGADLNHCYFSHVEATFGWSGRTVGQQIDYLQKVVEKGSTLSFNNFGNWNHTKPADLVSIIKELTNRGFDDRMAATLDAVWSFDHGDLRLLWQDTNEEGGDRTYSYLLRKAVPWMIENGIPEKSTRKFIVENPKRIFSISV